MKVSEVVLTFEGTFGKLMKSIKGKIKEESFYKRPQKQGTIKGTRLNVKP